MSDFWALENSVSHTLPDQIKRQKSATKTALLSLNAPLQIGQINDYQVSLYACSCTDFRQKKQPCKHMYRLAHELKIFDLGSFDKKTTYLSSASNKAPSTSTKEAVSKLPDNIQKSLHKLLYHAIFRTPDKPFYQISQSEWRALSDTGLIERNNSPDLIRDCLSKEQIIARLTNPLVQINKSKKKSELFAFYLENYQEDFLTFKEEFIFVSPSPTLSEHARAVYNDILRRFPSEKTDISWLWES